MRAAMGEWSLGKKYGEELCLRDDTCRLNNEDKPCGLSSLFMVMRYLCFNKFK